AQVCIDYAGVRRFTIAALQSIAGHDPRVAVGITVVHIVSDEHGELFIHDKRVVEGNVQRNVELLVAEDGIFSKTYLRIESEDGILLGHSISHHFSVLDRLRAGASPGPVSFFHHNMLTLVTAERDLHPAVVPISVVGAPEHRRTTVKGGSTFGPVGAAFVEFYRYAGAAIREQSQAGEEEYEKRPAETGRDHISAGHDGNTEQRHQDAGEEGYEARGDAQPQRDDLAQSVNGKLCQGSSHQVPVFRKTEHTKQHPRGDDDREYIANANEYGDNTNGDAYHFGERAKHAGNAGEDKGNESEREEEDFGERAFIFTILDV